METKQTYTEKWECGSCDTLHDDEDAAEECCRPEIRNVLVCTVCEKTFGEYKVKDAAACHPDGYAIRRCLCGNVIDERDEDPSALLGSMVWCATCRERDELKESLLAYMDEFLQKAQDSDTPFDCYIADRTARLMRDAAFSVIESVENAQLWLKREGHLTQRCVSPST